jgi:2-iminobutanoate/2-iminopropanoate deaminase
MNKEIVNTENAPAPIGPYNQAVKAGGLLFISGQIPAVPGSSEMKTGNIKEETRQVMQNIKAILDKAGLSFDNIVKTTIFLKDMSLFAEVNEEYGSHFKSDFPARETVAVKGLPKDVNVEISMIASAN